MTGLKTEIASGNWYWERQGRSLGANMFTWEEQGRTKREKGTRIQGAEGHTLFTHSKT